MSYKLGFTQQKEGWSDAPIAADTSWTMGRYWGEGLKQGNKPVTQAQAIQAYTSWVYICASLNATSVASVPLKLYAKKTTKTQKFNIKTKAVTRKTRDRLFAKENIEMYLKDASDVEEVVEHPFLDLWANPNPFIPSFVIKEETTLFNDLTGGAYWFVRKDSIGTPMQLWVIPSQYVTPIHGGGFDDFVVGYRFERGQNVIEMSRDDVVYFPTANPQDSYSGFGIVRGVADAVYIYWKTDEYEEALFENKARVGGVLEASETISSPEMARLKLDWQQKYSGAAMGGKTLFLPPGLKFTKDSMSPQEISFVEGRRVTRNVICAGFNQPASLYDEKANRANAEAAQFFYAKNGILPRTMRQEEVMNHSLLPMYGNEPGDLFVAYDDPVPEDKEFALASRTANVDSGIISINEARDEIGMDAIENADVPYISNTRVPLGFEPPEPEAPALPGVVDEDGKPVKPDAEKPKKPKKPKPEKEDETEKLANELERRTLEKLREKLFT